MVRSNYKAEDVSGDTVDMNRAILLHGRMTKSAGGDGHIVGKPFDDGAV